MAGVKETAAENGCTWGHKICENVKKYAEQFCQRVKDWAGKLNNKAQSPMDNSDVKVFDIKNTNSGR